MNRDLRVIGTVIDASGRALTVGQDYDGVSIGPYILGPAVRDDFARLYFKADEAAKAWAVANPQDGGDDAA